MNNMQPDELISVIVPAWNAQKYIDRTLESIRNQTHRNIEVIIVDDGSTDRTAEIAQAWVDKDPRFRLLRKENGGVASARNAGIAAARGRLVAPCDADDLWSPAKLECQLDAWRKAGSNIGLVYSWSVEIDANDCIQNYGPAEIAEGDVFARMCQGNLIGNGSAALMLRDAVIEAGGYDPQLRERGAQGCEDFKLYTQIAAKHAFAATSCYCVAYRHTDGNMSSDLRQMLRSYDIVLSEFAVQYPERAEDLAFGRACLIDWLATRAVRMRRPRDFIAMMTELSRHNFFFSVKSLYWSYGRPLARRWKRFVLQVMKHPASSFDWRTRKPRLFLGPPGSGAMWEPEPASSMPPLPVRKREP